ncbi:MAG: glycoside hydrolase family protein [Alphaproteobacteria bacterium]|nr:glycoside hydrolase family protein [Alphaproteobacteria bacterium]MBR6730346.1 glycoside hydrolase family protein [Alphaproteobacteria bacterium]
MNEKLMYRLIEEEGMKLKPYRCPAGKLTIGVGRNLEDKGLSNEEALFLLQNDIIEAVKELKKAFLFFDSLNETRQIVLIDMCFNLGINGLKKFKKMIKALENKDFSLASKEMLSSCWAKQVGARARSLALLMETGE